MELTLPTELISAPLLVGQEVIVPNVQRSHHLADKCDGPDDRPAPVTKSRCLQVKPMSPVTEPTPSAGGGRDLPSEDLVESASPKSVVHKEVVDTHHQYPAPKAGTMDGFHQHPAPKARVCQPRIPPPPAESGCPETGAEFAARVKDKFILRGPCKRTEGGMGTSTHPPSTSTPETNSTLDESATTENETRHPAPITYPHDEHLLQEAKG